METSNSRNLFFCAGSTSRDVSGRGEGVLAAVTFDRALNLVVEKVMDQANISACTAIRRFPGTDDLVVGCMRHMLIVSWVGDDFIVNNIVENVHTSKPLSPLTSLDIFSDISLNSNKIYSVCRDDPYVAQTMYNYA